MSTMFNRVAKVTISPPLGGVGRTFDCPPFFIEFDQKLNINGTTTTTLKIFNPNSDTIEASTASIINGNLRGANVSINAGYFNASGTCCVGEAYSRTIKRQGTDIVLTLEISDTPYKFSTALVAKSWNNQLVSQIISDACQSVGIAIGTIDLGADQTLKNYSAKSSFSSVIRKLCNQTKSQFYFKNGLLNIDPLRPKNKVVAQYLDETSGLIGNPETKISNMIKSMSFQTLFFYNLNLGDYVQINSQNFRNTIGRIITGNKKFSMSGQCQCEFEAQMI